MATSGQVQTNIAYDSYFWVKWEQSGNQDIANNKTNIKWSCGVYCGHNFYSNAIKMSAVTINGTMVYSGGTYSNYNEGNHTIASGTLAISHNTDGTKKFTISAFTGWLYSNNNYSASAKEFTLNAIPRYANFTSHYISSKTETTITVYWNADATCDAIQYSLNSGAWTTISGYPQYTISGLIANTPYTIKTRIRRKDSQLWTESGVLNVATYYYPHCTNSPDFTIGDALTLDFYNPLGRSIEVVGYAKSNGTAIFKGSTTGTKLVGFNDEGSVTLQYSSIPNSKSGAYKVVVKYGDVVITRDNGNKYSIRGNETPTINGITYRDANSKVSSITGNDQHIVQNQSQLEVTVESATAKRYASISKYKLTVNGVTKTITTSGTVDFGQINSATDCEVVVEVTDSRGMTNTAKKKITMLAWSPPNFSVKLERLNNYEDETYLTVDASISSVNNKNAIEAIGYRLKEDGGNYEDNDRVELSNNTQHTLTCDKNKAYMFRIAVDDKFGVAIKEIPLEKGKFPLFIDTEKNAVGINDFPAENEALRVAGGVARFNDGIVLCGDTQNYLIKITDSGTFSITKI